jgi:hypothetical protein
MLAASLLGWPANRCTTILGEQKRGSVNHGTVGTQGVWPFGIAASHKSSIPSSRRAKIAPAFTLRATSIDRCWLPPSRGWPAAISAYTAHMGMSLFRSVMDLSGAFGLREAIDFSARRLNRASGREWPFFPCPTDLLCMFDTVMHEAESHDSVKCQLQLLTSSTCNHP